MVIYNSAITEVVKVSQKFIHSLYTKLRRYNTINLIHQRVFLEMLSLDLNQDSLK